MKKNLLRRGFKTEANAYAREFRSELGLAPHDPLCPWKLAEHLAIPVLRLADLQRDQPQAVAYLLGPKGRSEFSAVTFFCDRRRFIIYNEAHHERRQRSDLAHELSHGILGHPPVCPLTETGSRIIDRVAEAEAEWMGPALLISAEAAAHIVESELTMPQAQSHYGVSIELIQMRIGVTGAKIRAQRRRGRTAA